MRFYVRDEKLRHERRLQKPTFWQFRTFEVFENIYDPSKWWTFCSIESLTTRVIIWQIIAHQMTVNDQNWLFLVIHTVHGRRHPNQDSNRTMVLSFLTLNESFLVISSAKFLRILPRNSCHVNGSVIFASSPAAKMIDLDLTSRASPTTATKLDIFVNRITLFNFHGKPLFIGTFEYLINLEIQEFSSFQF